MNQLQADKLCEVIPSLPPNIIYAIANEALSGAFQDFMFADLIGPADYGEQIFLACWNAEKGNNGFFHFIKNIETCHINRAGELIDNNV